MKISLIYDFLTEFGGLEREMFNHAKMLKEEGHEVEVLTCYYDIETIKKMNLRDVKIKNISRFKVGNEFLSLALCFLGFTDFKDLDADVIVSYSFPANYLLRKKIVPRVNFMNHYPHYLYLSEKDKKEWATGTKGIKRQIVRIISWFLGAWLRKIDKKYVRGSILNFANSNFTKKRLDALYGVECVVGYPPLDKIFKPSKERIKERFIFSSGRIIPDKKYEWLIESVALMKNKLPLFISGQGEESYKNKLLNLARKKKVNLKFVGRLSTEDLLRHYSSAEVFAFSTPKEDFGLVPAESLACETPVVVWGDGAGPTEQVIDGENGYYAKPYDFADFAEKLDFAIDEKLKKKNYKKIIESAKKFSYQSVKKDFVREIAKAITRHSLSKRTIF